MMKTLFRGILYVLSPAFPRAVLLRQVRVAIYLSNGHVVKFNCASWKINLRPGQKSYDFQELSNTVAFDVAQIIGVKEINWF